MNLYLTASELAGLIGCRKNSFSCMRRWLTKNEWPFPVTITGFPSVSRTYHDSRMHGHVLPSGPPIPGDETAIQSASAGDTGAQSGAA